MDEFSRGPARANIEPDRGQIFFAPAFQPQRVLIVCSCPCFLFSPGRRMRMFWSSRRQRLRATQRSRVRRSLETLEGRVLPSVSPLTGPVDLQAEVRTMQPGPGTPQAIAAATPATSSATPGFAVVPSPTVTRSFLNATTLIADSDIWAVGFTSPFSGPDATLAEHFNGTSWTVVATPN